MQILIIDFGSQYTALIGRSLRELGVRSLILPPDRAEKWLKEHAPKGIILSGGAASVYEDDAPKLSDAILRCGIPLFGICYGMQYLAHVFGGIVEPVRGLRGYGEAEFEARVYDPLFRGIHGFAEDHSFLKNRVWESHGDSVVRVPEGFSCIGYTNGVTIAAMSSLEKKIWGLQFHPEVQETEQGKRILKNFLEICGVTTDWSSPDLIQEISKNTMSAVPLDVPCIMGFSGGVDSTTLAAILAPIFGERLVCVTIDCGQLRAGEFDEICDNARIAGIKRHIVRCDHSSICFGEEVDAEAKRLLFQMQYRAILEYEAKKAGALFLLQGTLAPDMIESRTIGAAAHIKTHHNVGLVSDLVQLHPLRELFKYEVRDLARHLKLPAFISERMPFPGPGLFCRIVGVPVNAKHLEIVRWADYEVRKMVREAGIERDISQLVVALLGLKTVGVKGDGRSYGYAIGIRAVQTSDFMTCRGYQLPPALRRRLQKTLTAHEAITRVWFDENDKPPATVEFE